MILLGSVARKYLCYLLSRHLGPEPGILPQKRRSRTASELLNTIGQFRRGSNFNFYAPNNGALTQTILTDRNISGNTLLAHSPLHDDQGDRGPLAPLLYSQTETHDVPVYTLAQRVQILASKIDLDDVAIDPAPFQLVKGTSLYKLREALSNIYSRGAVPIRPRAKKISTYRVAHTSKSVVEEDENVTPQVSATMPVNNTSTGNAS
uniref:Uncharacterized protein n=1 Tax=Angiostrongylus cantonensis TaxID=6313 RepID=A0A0K0CUI7_ANGCA